MRGLQLRTTVLIATFLVALGACAGEECGAREGMYDKVNAKETLAGIDFWDLPGYTRSVYKPDHALIAPESRVYAPLFGWKNTVGAVTISPKAQGSRFTMTLVNLGANASSALPLPGVERFILVTGGTVEVATAPKRGAGEKRTLGVNAFAYFPAGLAHTISSATGGKALMYEQVYQGPEGAVVAMADGTAPKFVSGDVEEQPLVPVAPEMFALRKLLPTTPEYDFNIHVMDFDPGEYLYVKEIHYNQHGLVLLEGQGIYRLADSWYPVQAGDCIWMAPFVIQWYAALGKTRSRYIINKDTNRDPMQR